MARRRAKAINAWGGSVIGDNGETPTVNSPEAAAGLQALADAVAAGFEFIQFVQSEENQASFAEQSFPPVLASVYDDPELIEQHPYLSALKEALENAQPRPISPFCAAISKAIHDNATAAITGSVPVEQALADMESAISAAGQ
ncbi:hypothetical protein GCM10011490_16840 [Pseudoclavibacter endophyticus]|uniref:Extracellular solute-binding protein n=1 Tax=Pseudoclavibacter endophyticus TaxID=1778590 RepID=A0A6H9WI20_9MICO|nr:hypothetical protein [Pseudoclavibacter endophyticus]KAB1648953.1 hypothetical protein F8O04_01245 [Pseudoclavibacter endophyticus]GGA66806.1 hypothetical protein GCM10011490_16840 [Pseudoclavibacter endophyticus]